MFILGKLQELGGFLVVLGLVVFVHEFGHFAVAKLFSMRVFVFSFGFGRRLLGFKWGDTDCRISLLPLGGYVRLEGEPEDPLTGGEDPSLETQALADGTLVTVANPNYFTNRPRWQRILVYVAGPAMNAVLTITILTIFHMLGYMADASLFDKPVIGTVVPGSPAERAGLQPGDTLLTIDGKRVEDWYSVLPIIAVRPNARYAIRVARGDSEQSIDVQAAAQMDSDKLEIGRLGISLLVRVVVQPDGAGAAAGLQSNDGVLAVDGHPVTAFEDLVAATEAAQGRTLHLSIWRAGRIQPLDATPLRTSEGFKLGVGPKQHVERAFDFAQALPLAVRQTWKLTETSLDTLWQLVRGRLSTKALAGPIGIAKASARAAREGAVSLFFLAAFISLQVGLLNLILPFIPFDGGHLALLLVESVMRRDLSMRARDWVMNAGFGVVVLLIALVFYSDLSKISFLRRFFP